MKFGELLRQTREGKGMSRRELADASGVPFGTIHGYEDGRRSPSFANALRLAKALGTDCTAFSECDDLTTDEQESDPPFPPMSPAESSRPKGKRK